jgi:hypothetical protein
MQKLLTEKFFLHAVPRHISDTPESGSLKESCLLLVSLVLSRSEVGVSSTKRKRIDRIVVMNFYL